MMPSRIQRPEARVLAETEFGRFAELVGSLSDADWERPTDCTAWDVRKLALHVLGSADAAGLGPRIPSSTPARDTREQGDRFASLGRRAQRTADP